MSADSDPSADIGSWIRQLTTRAVEDQLHALQRYGELLRRVASGDLDERRVGEETLRFLRQEAVRYARGVAGLSVEYQHALLDLDRARNDEFFSLVLDEVEEADAAQPQRVELPLRGRLTEQVAAAFTIENTTARPSDVAIEVSDVTDHEGERFRVPVTIDPAAFALDPGAKQQVRFVLQLADEVFTAGSQYRMLIGVHGPDDLEVAVHLTVDDPPAIVVTTGASDATGAPDPTAAPDAVDPPHDAGATDGNPGATD